MAAEVRLGEVAEIIMGQSPPGETYDESGEGLPFFQGVADFNYRHPTPRVYCPAPSRVANPGDIMLSVRAPIGRVNVADRECAIGRGLCIIRARTPEDGRYLEFALRAMESQWDAIEGSGSVFGNATRRDLETLPVPWPEDAAYRRAIARILGTLDDKSEGTDVYWLQADRKKGEYPEPTGRSGKWLVFVPVAERDETWQKIKQATEEGKPGGSAKVATMKPNPNGSNPNVKVICVYTYDWTDEKDIKRVRAVLRELGIDRKIAYKADDDTFKGRYVVKGDTKISKYYE